MKKTGKQIGENELNAVNGGNIYIVKSSNGAVEYYNCNGERGTPSVDPMTGKIRWTLGETLGRNGAKKVEATKEQMDELRKNGKVTINGYVYKKGD